MRIRINLRLKLIKQKKTIKVSYHTFETASYDQYLIASLALRSPSVEEANQYIADITGQGSLNAHFLSLYQEISKLSPEELQSVLTNSRIPMLKIDASNWYDFYPELNISVFKRRIYTGDLGEYPNIIELLQIQEEVVEKEVILNREFDRPETHLVRLTDQDVSLQFFESWATISSEIFQKTLVTEINNIQGFLGTIHNEAEGDGWYVLTQTKLNNLATTSSTFFDANGDHCFIRNTDIRKTMIAIVNGLYIYKEVSVPYDRNPELCNKVLDNIVFYATTKNSSINMLLILLNNVNVERAQEFINNQFGLYFLPKEIAGFVERLIRYGNVKKWHKAILQGVLKVCDQSLYPTLYHIDSTLSFTIEQLIALDPAILTDEHRAMVEAYLNDLNEMKNTIIQIIGEITTSGLRERVKTLKADADTRRFTKLCNDLIGHVKSNLTTAKKAETETWLSAALELKDLAVVIEKKLQDA